MTEAELAGVLDFLRQAEGLKTTRRSGYTSAGEPETVAEHTWRLCLMALVLQPEIPDVDFVRLVKVCLVHDLGEVFGGDVHLARRSVERRVLSPPGVPID